MSAKRPIRSGLRAVVWSAIAVGALLNLANPSDAATREQQMPVPLTMMEA